MTKSAVVRTRFNVKQRTTQVVNVHIIYVRKMRVSCEFAACPYEVWRRGRRGSWGSRALSLLGIRITSGSRNIRHTIIRGNDGIESSRSIRMIEYRRASGACL